MGFSMRLFLLFISCTFISSSAWAQMFEYKENKGQWPGEVLYKGEVNGAAFFLKKDGYTVLLRHPEDYARAMYEISGHGHFEGEPGGATVPGKPGATVSEGMRASVAAYVADPESVILRNHAYQVRFLRASPSAPHQGTKAAEGVYNYFLGNDPTKWAAGVKGFGEVEVSQLYPGIDIRYYSENSSVKYDLLIHPNADISKIQLEYTGHDGLEIQKNGDLLVRTSVGNVRENYPYSFQVVNGQRQTVKMRYRVSGNVVSFDADKYDRSQMLIIDPSLVFSTFVGGQAYNWGYSAAADDAGNGYAAGIVFDDRFPVTTGAYQTVFRGGSNTGESEGYDIGIVKVNPRGSRRIYTTYLGGGNNEAPHSMITDAAENLYVAGRTISRDFPTVGGRVGTGGGWDIFVAKLDATGAQLLGGMIVGGANDDGVNIRNKYPNPRANSLQRNYGDDSRSEIILDGQGNAIVASCSQSADFPTTSGAYQVDKKGKQDGVVLKFASTLNSLSFATFLGSNEDDACYVALEAADGSYLIGGGTAGADFPSVGGGTVQPSFAGGGGDGFIVNLANDGSSIIRSTFIGTGGFDQVYGIQLDISGNVYCMGTSTGNFPVTNVGWSQNGGKQFVAKMNPTMSTYIYSTVFGTNRSVPNISPTAFMVDACERVCVTGWGINNSEAFFNSGTIGMITTPDAYQSVTDGNDFYFLVMEKDITAVKYATFFGQQVPGQSQIDDHVDGGTSRFDRRGLLYQAVCANCDKQAGSRFPTTPGTIGPVNPAQGCNLALLKFDLGLDGVREALQVTIDGKVGDSVGCMPSLVQFRDTLGLGTRYEWDFGDGETAVTTEPFIEHLYEQVGTYRVKLVSVDSSKCIPRDSSYSNIYIRDNFASLDFTSTKLPPCESNTYRFDNLSTSNAHPFKATSFTWDFGDGTPPVQAGLNSITHSFPGTGTYTVNLILTDTSYCTAPDTMSVELRISPTVDAAFAAVSGCAPDSVQFENRSIGGTSFLWTFHDGTTSTEINPTKYYDAPGTYNLTLQAIDSNTCNIIDIVDSVVVLPGYPTAGFSFSPTIPEANVTPSFTNTSLGATRYQWDMGDGTTFETTRLDSVFQYQYRESGVYTVCLVAINDLNCADSICMEVEVIVEQAVDVVTAFTPNGDGVNDRAVVKGFGIDRMVFRIFNRWGQMVYESSDINDGWDGTFNGKAQPMDAYGYTLTADLVDGSTLRKSGSITLIR